MKHFHHKLLAYGLWLTAILFAVPIYAAPPPSTPLTNPLRVDDIPTLVGTIIKAGLGIVGAVALAMFIWGGFLWLTAAGDPTKIKEGKGTLVWAVIGLIFIFSSYIIANFVIAGLTGQG